MGTSFYAAVNTAMARLLQPMQRSSLTAGPAKPLASKPAEQSKPAGVHSAAATKTAPKKSTAGKEILPTGVQHVLHVGAMPREEWHLDRESRISQRQSQSAHRLGVAGEPVEDQRAALVAGAGIRLCTGDDGGGHGPAAYRRDE